MHGMGFWPTYNLSFPTKMSSVLKLQVLFENSSNLDNLTIDIYNIIIMCVTPRLMNYDRV